MMLGEMLIRDGRLTPENLKRVMAQQSREGGRLGSLLVAAGLIDAPTLTVYLGLELGIPIATMETFERCKRSAVLLLTPDQASRFMCIPIVIQGQTLIVAVENPHDLQALEEISKETGYRIIPRVAPEIIIYLYLERFYGVPQPHRFAQITAQAPSQPAVEAGKNLPAPPLPGLPPKVDEPTAAPNPAPELRSGPAPKPNRAETEESEALELDAADLIEELEADDEEVAEAAGPNTPSAAATKTPPPPKSERPDPISQADAIQIISETTQRSDIADAILAHSSELFEVATLLLVRDNMAFGWKGFGPGLDLDRIETLLIPLDTPSMFKAALGEDRHFRAHAFSNSLHSHWFRILRSPTPETSIVVICSIGKRIVNLLYGHTTDGKDLPNDKMDGLMDIMNASALAYLRLISKSKSSKGAAAVPAKAQDKDEGEDVDGDVDMDDEESDDEGAKTAATQSDSASKDTGKKSEKKPSKKSEKKSSKKSGKKSAKKSG